MPAQSAISDDEVFRRAIADEKCVTLASEGELQNRDHVCITTEDALSDHHLTVYPRVLAAR